MNSLTSRLLAANLVVLAGFVSLTGFALEQAVYRSALGAEEDRLQGLVYGILGAADLLGPDALAVNPDELPDPRLLRPDSGVYAVMLDGSGRERWRSPSYLEVLPADLLGARPEVGEWRFEYRQQPAPFFALLFGIRWLAPEDTRQDAPGSLFHVLVFSDAERFERRKSRFQTTLWVWLVVSALLLTAVQYAVLRWGLIPLRRVAGQVREIESGERRSLEGRYPSELHGVVDGLNELLGHEERQKSRYRHALDDLAHSLKTPLAALRGLVDSPGEVTRERIAEQVARMDQIIRYQLGRAATAGRQALRRPVALTPVAEKVGAALAKVYRDRQIDFALPRAPGPVVRIDAEDLLELLGNLLDNAAKHCAGRVALEVDDGPEELVLVVDDDGPGFPADAQRLLQRGVRADSRNPGQGIGLAMVAEIAAAYGGRVVLGRSPWGGARVGVHLPHAGA